MIRFSCKGCGKTFLVPDEMLGKRGKCKSCGARILVAPDEAQSPAAPPKLPMRIRRLSADAEAMQRAFTAFPLIRIRSTKAAPPDSYELEYFVTGLEQAPGKEPVERHHHVAEIQLTSDYPRMSPICKMLTPIFHPNIDASTICIGDHWAAGERLVDLAVRIAEMISYQAYNIKSPLNAEAAMWADLHRDKLPVDARNLHPQED
jgi:ubiquitin-protein ligase